MYVGEQAEVYVDRNDYLGMFFRWAFASFRRLVLTLSRSVVFPVRIPPNRNEAPSPYGVPSKAIAEGLAAETETSGVGLSASLSVLWGAIVVLEPAFHQVH